MIVKLLNGKDANINLRKNIFDKKSISKSNFQKEIGLLLKKDYPYDLIFHEVRIPGENFILDFFIPSLNIVIECNGRQHYEQIKFFHKTKKDFHNQQDRDNRKREWCELNNFRLIEICYD